MFEEIEKGAREELCIFFSKFISNEKEGLEELLETISHKYFGCMMQLSPEVARGLNLMEDFLIDELTKEQAKEILKKLKQSEKTFKMKSMFEEFNKTLKKKLIALYEDFIENPEDEILKENAAMITCRYSNSGDFNLDKDINFALGKALDLELGTLSKKQVKEILKKLKNSE